MLVLKNLFLIALFSLLGISSLSAQENKEYFYQGTVDNRPVRFYLKQFANNCGGNDTYTAMYQYGKGKNWIELQAQTNEKGNFCFTEIRFTGVIILKKTQNRLNGIWISPDGKKQLVVALSQQSITPKEIEALEERLEITHYENFDC